MRHSAVVCDVYQTTDVPYLDDSELWIMSTGVRLFSMKKKYALLRPSSGHYGGHTKHEGYGRKEDGRETLYATLC
jgi:hypothetical protein